MLKKDIYNLRYALIIIFVYCFVMQFFCGTVCPFKAFLNIDCPACGMTRATIYLLTGNFRKSMEYNPTTFFWLISIFSFLIDRYVKKLKIRPFPLLFIISGVITISWYILKSII